MYRHMSRATDMAACVGIPTSTSSGTYFDCRIARWSVDGAVAAPSRIGTHGPLSMND